MKYNEHMTAEEAKEDKERDIEDRERYDAFARFRQFSKRLRPSLKRWNDDTDTD